MTCSSLLAANAIQKLEDNRNNIDGTTSLTTPKEAAN
ncbi:hypothetical protein ACVWVY_000352 [Bradyrhizobium sp. URHC0002]|jgi:hypothetical protein